MFRAEDALLGNQDVLEQRDRIGGPARGLIGAGQAVLCAEPVRMIGPQHPLEVRDQLLADRDGVRHAVA